MKEVEIQQLVRMEASNLGAIVWRNNTGALKDANGRLVRYGLCPGSSDLIGLFKGRFLALEIKKPGKKATVKQQNFINAVNRAGGIAGVVTSVEDLKNLLTDV